MPLKAKMQAYYKSKKNSTTKKIARLSKAIKQIKTGEIRNSLINTAFVTVTQAGSAVLLNGLNVGDGESLRQGNTINLYNLESNIHIRPIQPATVATGVNYQVRIILVVDHEPVGAVMTNATLLGNGASDANNYQCPFNFLQRRRFQVLYDKVFAMSPQANTRAAAGATVSDPLGARTIKIRKRFKTPLQVQYNNGTAGTVADLVKNSVYLLAFCNMDADAEWKTMNRIVYQP